MARCGCTLRVVLGKKPGRYRRTDFGRIIVRPPEAEDVDQSQIDHPPRIPLADRWGVARTFVGGCGGYISVGSGRGPMVPQFTMSLASCVPPSSTTGAMQSTSRSTTTAIGSPEDLSKHPEAGPSSKERLVEQHGRLRHWRITASICLALRRRSTSPGVRPGSVLRNRRDAVRRRPA